MRLKSKTFGLKCDMAKLLGVNQSAAIRAFERAGFRIERQSGHIIMSDGVRRITIPRNNPINAFTMGAIVKD